MNKNLNIKSKKGMSPLLATVILIAFAVAIGAMIVNWSTNINMNSCKSARIEFLTIRGSPSICYLNNTLRIVVVSKGEVPLSGLKITMTDKSLNIHERIIEKEAKKGDTIRIELPYNKSIVRIDVYPIIEQLDSSKICIDNGIYVEDINECK